MRGDQPSLEGCDLYHAYGRGEVRTVALDGVSLALWPAQVSLLMGPSGSGKSTLLAALSGLLRPERGRVLALGEDLWRLSERKRERFRLRHFGFIFQGYNLFPALSARQHLEMVLRWGEGTTRREARRRSMEMLDLLGLGRQVSLRPAQLSGGEKQRVGVGRALIKNPEFCLADEPTSALDWEHGGQVVQLLRNAAHERGATILIVSHDPRIVPFADQVFRIEDGRLTDAADSPRTVQPGPEAREPLLRIMP